MTRLPVVSVAITLAPRSKQFKGRPSGLRESAGHWVCTLATPRREALPDFTDRPSQPLEGREPAPHPSRPSSRKRPGRMRSLSRKQVTGSYPLWVRVPPLPLAAPSSNGFRAPGSQPGDGGSIPSGATRPRILVEPTPFGVVNYSYPPGPLSGRRAFSPGAVP
jgi:hypothetical protein